MILLPVHPLAELFPLIEGVDFDRFADDIRDNGVRDRIELLDGQILDGRNRYNALVQLVESGELLGEGWGHRAGEPLAPEHLLPDNQWFRKFNRNVDGDPLPWVLSKNLKRRHLDESQRAMVAAKLSNMNVGRPSKVGNEQVPAHIPSIDGISARAAASMMNVGTASVDRARAVLKHGVADLQHAVSQGQLAVSAAEKIARLPDEQQSEALARAVPSDHRAIMASRQEPDDSLDYFPTPPWATRALVEKVFRDGGLPPFLLVEAPVWEPACGEGHIAEVLREYGCDVFASDVHDYGHGDAVIDFLAKPLPAVSPDVDFVITNSPFGDKCEAFALRALDLARIGVAMFVPLRWLETIGRYENLFRDRPPTLIAFFAERVNLCKGRWEPEGSTATAYIWLVWIKGAKPLPPYWIPPGCRTALTRPDDARRFTAHPVIKAAPIEIPEFLPVPAPEPVNEIEEVRDEVA
jgi:hypothetical protein